MLDYLQKGKAEELINDFILLNDTRLMDITFIEEVKLKLPANWNEFAKRSDAKKKKAYSDAAMEYLLQRKATLNDVLITYNLNDKQIPTRILNYWLNIKDVEGNRSVSDRIKLMKRDCMSRLKVLEKHKLDKSVKTPKVGEMATFLAKDIVDMMVSKEKKQKITSFYYDKMQECLALFADTEKKALFIHIVTNELKVLEGDGHPFLTNINLQQIRKTSQFYELYMNEKVEYLNRFYKPSKDKVDKRGRPTTEVKLPPLDKRSNIPFTIRQWDEKEKYNLNAWLRNVTVGKNVRDGKKAVNLPTNLFDETLCDLLSQQLDARTVNYNPAANYNELLKLWWKTRDDATQDFYQSEREYDIYEEKVEFKIDSSGHFADYYKKALSKAYNRLKAEREIARRTNKRLPPIEHKQVERVFKNTIAETEKEIRMLQEEDRMAVLMLEQLMDDSGNLKLSTIKTSLNDTTQIKQKILNKTIVAERKQKNYTELRKYIHDRRLPNLFEYVEADEILLEWLLDELRAYNAAKQQVFDTIFMLEKKIIETDPQELKSLFTNEKGQVQTGNIQHKPYVQWLKNKGLINDNEKLFINMVRNCFSHNQFPQRETMELLISELGAGKIATQILTVYNQLITNIINKI